MKKTAIIIMLISFVMKGIGFFREVVLSYYYGTSSISDAYLIALTIPGTIFAFIGSGIITTFIPMYNKVEEEEGIEKADYFTSIFINITILLSSIIILVIVSFSDFFVKLFASGFEGDVFELTVLFTKIASIEIIFISLVYIITAYLNIKNKFLIPLLISLPFNIAIISFIVLSSKFGLIFLPVGNIFAGILQVIFLIIFLMKSNFKYKFSLDIKNKNLIKALKLSIPTIIGVSVNQINVLIDKTLASRIAIGGISALNYASKLNSFVQGIFIFSLVTVIYPKISKLIAEGKILEMRNIVEESIKTIFFLLLPITVGTIFFSQEIVALLFGRGAFDKSAVLLTSQSLLFYSISIIAFGIREILTRVFYAIQDTQTPVINASIGVVLNIVLNIILSKYMGIPGLALATSISAIITVVLMWLSIHKRIKFIFLKEVFHSGLKLLGASLFMGVVARLSFDYLYLFLNQNISLAISVLIGFIIYLSLAFFMKVEELNFVLRLIRSNKILNK